MLGLYLDKKNIGVYNIIFGIVFKRIIVFMVEEKLKFIFFNGYCFGKGCVSSSCKVVE